VATNLTNMESKIDIYTWHYVNLFRIPARVITASGQSQVDIAFDLALHIHNGQPSGGRGLYLGECKAVETSVFTVCHRIITHNGSCQYASVLVYLTVTACDTV
jgi:hypothetical protein